MAITATSATSATSASLTGPAAAARSLERYRLLANLLDTSFRVPGTNWRFGLDPLLGLIPGAGDLATSLLGLYGVLLAHRLGAPAHVKWRMIGNLAIDALAGSVPVIGDVFDFAFKAHIRNRTLLEKWLAKRRAKS